VNPKAARRAVDPALRGSRVTQMAPIKGTSSRRLNTNDLGWGAALPEGRLVWDPE